MKTDIDLVYLWVDGNDLQWQLKRNAFCGNSEENSEINCKGRYANNDELKYSLRSAEKYAPWIRKIFIVTDNQIPEWLDITNPKIKIIDHKEIMPEICLPCFNSNIIEYFLYKIPDLSENFLYANDDMFFNANVEPDFFFTKNMLPVVRLKRLSFGKLHFWSNYWVKFLMGKKPGQYRTIVKNASDLVKQKEGKYISGIPYHNIDSYNKSDYREAIEVVFREQVENSLTHHIRNYGDLQRVAILYYILAIGRGQLLYANKQDSIRISVFKNDFKKILIHNQSKLFCLNDSQRVKDDDRKKIKPFLEELFPEKTKYEK